MFAAVYWGTVASRESAPADPNCAPQTVRGTSALRRVVAVASSRCVAVSGGRVATQTRSASLRRTAVELRLSAAYPMILAMPASVATWTPRRASMAAAAQWSSSSMACAPNVYPVRVLPRG